MRKLSEIDDDIKECIDKMNYHVYQYNTLNTLKKSLQLERVSKLESSSGIEIGTRFEIKEYDLNTGLYNFKAGSVIEIINITDKTISGKVVSGMLRKKDKSKGDGYYDYKSNIFRLGKVRFMSIISGYTSFKEIIDRDITIENLIG